MSLKNNNESLALQLENIDSFYGELQVLRQANLHVNKGEVVALFGPNGHGKSTLLKAIAGLQPPAFGSIKLNGEEIVGLGSDKIVEQGIALIPEDRHLFPEMTVLENLMMGAFNRNARKNMQQNLETVYRLFPKLAERKAQLASTLSGGEARMLAVGRGMMSSASMLLIDEPSIGLSPLMKQTVFDAVQKIKEQGEFSILIVEQVVDYPLSVADRIYILKNGVIVTECPAAGITKKEIEKAYF